METCARKLINTIASQPIILLWKTQKFELEKAEKIYIICYTLSHMNCIFFGI